MSPDLIFWPMIVLAFATLYLYVPMSKTRVKGVKDGKIKAAVYKLGKNEPEESLKYTNAIRNQYETPVLFYAVCISAYVSGAASSLMVALAFLFAAIKLAHVYAHATTNDLRRRRPLFILAYFILAVMWAVFAIQLLLK